MKAKSIKGKSVEDIKMALEQSLIDGYMPTLAIVFMSVKLDRLKVTEILVKKGLDVFGATSSGEFIEGHQDEGSIVIMLLDLRRDAYAILFEDVSMKNQAITAEQMATKALEHFDNPAFILATTSIDQNGDFFIKGETVVRGIEKVVGNDVTICGGMAGDDITFSGTFVFTNKHDTNTGLLALILDKDRVSLEGMAISGWKPIGLDKTITKSIGSKIYTIDGQPALDLYLKYLGKEINNEKDKYELFMEIGVHYPFQLLKPVGEPALFSPFTVDQEENALICEIDVPEGSKIRFSMPPDFDIVDTVINEAADIRKKQTEDADALLVFSCAGRLQALGPLANLENQGLQEVWNAPMAGFYSYGEFGRAKNSRQEFHSTTCCWVALKEK